MSIVNLVTVRSIDVIASKSIEMGKIAGNMTIVFVLVCEVTTPNESGARTSPNLMGILLMNHGQDARAAP
jgi:hypothetical protein